MLSNKSMREFPNFPEFPEHHGTGECIRYLLKYGDSKLASMKDSVEDWLKYKNENMPKFAHHAVTIARLLGNHMGLASDDHWNNAKLESIALFIYDVLKDVEAWYKETDKKKKSEMLANLKHDVFDHCMTSLEEMLIRNNGNFDNKLTWLDFFVAAAIEVLGFYLDINMGTFALKYPMLFKLTKKIFELPQIIDYIQHRDNIL